MGIRIAMIGQRGVPATFGGIEHHVEQLGARLAARGHEVTVFCRTNYVPDRRTEYRGMRLRHVPAVSNKHLDAIVPSALSALAGLFSGYDIVHYHALGPGVFSPLSQYFSRAKVVQTIHGLDHDRAKWGRGARAFLKSGAWLSAHVPNATIVVSRDLAAHYRRRYGRSAVYVPNGVNVPVPRAAKQIQRRFGLAGGDYLFWVGRMVPEKGLDLLVKAFCRLPGDVRLVLGGGSGYADEYVEGLKRLAAGDPRVVFTGYVFGELLEELYSNAAAFVLPSDLEGLPLTLLEAVSYGTPVVASDIPPHVEVLGSDAPGGRLFPAGNETALGALLGSVLSDVAKERDGADTLRARVLSHYDWDSATEMTEDVYESVLGRRAGRVRDGRAAAGGGRD